MQKASRSNVRFPTGPRPLPSRLVGQVAAAGLCHSRAPPAEFRPAVELLQGWERPVKLRHAPFPRPERQRLVAGLIANLQEATRPFISNLKCSN